MIFIQIKSWALLPFGVENGVATFILRLYRFRKNRPRGPMGVVEEVGVKGRRAFNHYDELWDILNASKSVKSYRETRTRKKISSRSEEGGNK